ncbi:hypothetical protein [Moraxella sp.]|uniref:hypothetical protein n=1 Tax=Moraxella sp. TaxID=479 RepID=UPI0026DB1901|nr:hypothetical protein [Moraxella sp.]MDO4895016.1 hypothetical protein [Moraxella sp.]
MSKSNTGSADSHFLWKVSTDNGGSFAKVLGLIKMDMPSTEKVTDDVTRTDDTSPRKETVDFTEGGDVEFEMTLDPDDPVHIALEAAKESKNFIKSQVHFKDTRVKGFEFECQVSKFHYDPSDPKQKMRVSGKLALQGEIKRISSASE